MRRLVEKLEKAQHNRLRIWPLGVYLTIAALVVPAFRPPAASQAIATGRATGQIILVSLGIGLILWEILRSRRKTRRPR